MAPGSISTRPPEISLEALKFVESATRTVPPLVLVGFTSIRRKSRGFSILPYGDETWSDDSGPGTADSNMYSSWVGTQATSLGGTPKFFAITSLGVRESQSVRRKVEFSEKVPSAKTSRNSHPSCRAWIECGQPPGKNHRSPWPTSSMKFWP